MIELMRRGRARIALRFLQATRRILLIQPCRSARLPAPRQIAVRVILVRHPEILAHHVIEPLRQRSTPRLHLLPILHAARVVAREWLTERFVPIQQSPTLPAQLEPTIAPAKRAAALSVDEARWALEIA